MARSDKLKYYVFNGCCILIIIIGIFLIFFKFLFLDKLIQSMAADGAKMSNDTYNLWGIIPGNTETYTIRNFSIFNFTNPHQFLYQSKDLKIKPKFTEFGGFIYQQKSQFVNYQFTSNNQTLKFDYWLYFDLLEDSNDVDEKFTVINVAPLGFWMQLETTSIESFTLQGFGGLFVELNNTIKLQAIGQGVSGTFFPNYGAFQLFCNNQGLNNNTCWSIWNDPIYGLNNQDNYEAWVEAAYKADQKSQQFLYLYFFPLSRLSFNGFLSQVGKLCKIIDKIISNWYCGDEICSDYSMLIKQLASASVTNNPPSGTPSQSICSLNKTCIGSPEIPTFLHHEFKIKYPDERFQNLQFSQESVSRLFTPYKNLLNIGYIQQLYSIGTRYDSDHTTKTLSEIKEILLVETNDHALVIWEWVKYMTEIFVLKSQKGGTKQIAGLGAIFSQALYEVTTSFSSTLLEDLYAFIAHRKIGQKCLQFLIFLPEQIADSICNQIKFQQYNSYSLLIKPCLSYTKQSEFQDKHKLTSQQIQDYCDIDEDPSNIGKITLQIITEVAQWYNCTQSYYKKCTQRDIIIKQLISSQITKRPLQGYRPPSLTAHEWFNEIPTFQYQHYLFLANESDSQEHTQQEIRDLYTFDKLLNGPAVQELFLQTNEQSFIENYHWKHSFLLRNYIRYILIEVGFGGFTQQRSCKQLLFGYDDPFLKTLQQTDTLLGGDPSIQTLINFNELNSTIQEAKLYPQVMNTGMKQADKVRQFISLFEKSYITINRTSFNGEQIVWQMVTPWAENVSIKGTDGFQTPANLQTTDLPFVYLSSIARFSEIAYNRTIQKYGMELYDMRIQKSTLESAKDNQQNEKYYQNFTSLLNSSYQGFPLMITKTHFLDADKAWSERIILTDQYGNLLTANQYDDTRLYVEPFTGTSFSATISLQVNYYYEPNLLFPQYEYLSQQKYQDQVGIPSNLKLLPIANTFRSGNISSNAVDQYFGDLRWIVNARRGFAIFGFLLTAIPVFIILAIAVRKQITGQNKQKRLIKPSLLESEGNNQSQE